jgi:fructose-bisphosphate aldolase/2-amino-3,7-dideoxy-D-threo-hept-6-ulosonate synthase
MSGIGKSIRIRRILTQNGTVIVPIDHAIEGYYKELEEPGRLAREFVAAHVDAILVRRGTLFRVYDSVAGKMGIIYRMTGATGTSPDPSYQVLLSSVREAVRLGADAIVDTVTIGHPKEHEMFHWFGMLSDETHQQELPLVGETEVWSKISENRAELTRQGVRSLGEEGADLVKCYFPDDLDYYAKIVKYSLVPVVAAGGPKMDSGRDVLEFVKRVMDAGAVGTCMGRNVWQSSDPGKMIKAISRIVKEHASVETALTAL